MKKTSMLVAAALGLCLAGCEEKKKVVVVEPPAKSGVVVDAPGVKVDVGNGKVDVNAPGANVDVDTKK